MDDRQACRDLPSSERSNSRVEPASAFLARASRFSTAAVLSRKALAISRTLKPHKNFKMSASCASSGRRG